MNRSESIIELTKALVIVQGQLKGATKDAVNSHTNKAYADLASVWEACREPLSANGIAVFQVPTYDSEKVLVLETTLAHTSGEWASGVVPLLQTRGTNEMQSLGSALTYARRYGLCAMVGICPEDDDGNGAGDRQQERPERREKPKNGQRNGNGHSDDYGPPPQDQSSGREENFRDFLARMVREAKGTVNEPRLINALVSRAINAGAIADADVLTHEGKRDPARAKAALTRLYTERPLKVRKSAEAYVKEKLEAPVGADRPEGT